MANRKDKQYVMVIIEYCGQKIHQHKIKNEYWKSQGIEVVRLPLPVADYILMNDKIQDVIDRKTKRNLEIKKMDTLGTFNVSVDTKMDLMELYGCLVQSHDRFRDELLLAHNNNIKLYILTENKNDIKKIEDFGCRRPNSIKQRLLEFGVVVGLKVYSC